MDDSTNALKQQLFEALQALRKSHTPPPLPSGITPVEGHTLMMLSIMQRRGDAMRPGRAAELCHATPSAMSQTLSSLQKKGFIERAHNDNDSRAVEIRITQAGRDMELQGKRLHDARFDQMIEYLGREDTEELLRLVNRALEFERTCPWATQDESPWRGERPCA